MQDWNVYKQLTQLSIRDSTHHLYNTCDESVQVSLINTYENFLELSEEEALNAIKAVATVRVNPAVHRKAFGELIQGETESAKNYVVRLRAAACDCAFQCPNCEHDLSSINIKDQLIRGLCNAKLQAEVLAKANQLKSLDDIINYVEASETALRDQSKLSSGHDKNAPDSAFRFHQKKRLQRQQKQLNPPDATKERCKGCGNDKHDRATKCPAWGKDCLNCGLPNHFAGVCFRSQPQQQQQQSGQQEQPPGMSYFDLAPETQVEQIMAVKSSPKSDLEFVQCQVTIGP